MKSGYVKFNTGYMNKIVNDSGLTKEDFSRSLGMGNSFISTCIIRGTIGRASLNVIAKMYDADLDKLLDVEVENRQYQQEKANADYEIVKMIAKLEMRIEALETATNEPKKEAIILSENEKAVLLLKHMTMYGGCDEQDFISKAISYGFSSDVRKYAMDYLKCRIDVKGKSRWIIRK